MSRFPHPMVVLLGGVLLAALLTWIIPAGAYDRAVDPETGRELVVPGTYAPVSGSPVGLGGALLAVPRGIIAGADVIVVILFVGGAFALLDRTGALSRLIGTLLGRTRSPRLVVALVSVLFATLGALENFHEEIIALVPALVVLSRGLGYGAITALAMSVGAAVVGSAYGPTNPFAAGSAQAFADVPYLTGAALRLGLTAVATAVWIAWTLSQVPRDDIRPDVAPPSRDAATRRDAFLLALVILPFGPYVVGVLALGWGFNELSALFLVVAFAVGLTAGFGLRGTAVEYLKGMELMLTAALFVGLARAISLVLADGQVIDTIVFGLARPLDDVPRLAAAALMVPAHALIQLPVPSNSGHAALTMPIMAPLMDLLGMSRDVAVLAYQVGGPTLDAVVPTNGALLAMLLAAGVPFGRWLRFAVPGVLLVMAVGLVGLGLML
jgi:uncharacterized ion transporter superfamily protein YfcC